MGKNTVETLIANGDGDDWSQAGIDAAELYANLVQGVGDAEVWMSRAAPISLRGLAETTAARRYNAGTDLGRIVGHDSSSLPRVDDRIPPANRIG